MTYPPEKQRVFAAFEGRPCPVLSSLPLCVATVNAAAAARPVGVGRLPPPPPHPLPPPSQCLPPVVRFWPRQGESKAEFVTWEALACGCRPAAVLC